MAYNTPDSGPAGGQRERDRQVTPSRRGPLAACQAVAQPGYGDARQRAQAEHQHGYGLDQVGGHVPEVGTEGADAERYLPRPVAGPQRAAVGERVEDRHAGAEHADRREPPAVTWAYADRRSSGYLRACGCPVVPAL